MAEVQDIPQIASPDEEQAGNDQQPPDKVSQYYDYLKKAGADVAPSLDSFKKTLSSDSTARQYYGYLRQHHFDAPPDYGSFSRTLGIQVAPPAPEHQISHTPIQDVRHLNDLANQPIGKSSITGSSTGAGSIELDNPEDVARNKKYQEQYEKSATDLAGTWGTDPKLTKQAIQDFPDEPDENKLKGFAGLAKDNPVYYGRLKSANDIRMTIAKSGPDGVNDANVFNHLQTSQDYEQLQHNIALQQKIMHKHGLGQAYFEKLKESQAPLINTLDPDLHIQYWNSEDKKLGLSDFQYAGLETEKMFQPGKYQQDLAIIRHNRGLDAGGPTATPIPQGKEGYAYDRGVENVLYQLENQGRQNTSKFISQRRAQLGNDVDDLVKGYKEALAFETRPEDHEKMYQEFQNHPLIQEATKLDEGQQAIEYAQTEDQRRFPLNFGDQASRMVKDAMSSTNGIAGVAGKQVLLGAGESADNTMRFVKNTFINLLGSEQLKAENAASNIGHQALTQLAGYEGGAYSMQQSPLLVGDDLVKKIQDVNNNSSLSVEEKNRQSTDLVLNHQGEIKVNPKAGQQNLTGKAIIYSASNTIGQILGIADQSLLMGGLLGDASKAQQMANAVVPMYATTQNQLYEQALARGDEKPLLSSHLDAAIISLASLINADIKVVKGMIGAETGIGKLIAGVDESTWNKVLSTNKPLVDRMIAGTKATARQLGLANLQYGLIVPTAQYIVHKNVLNEDPNLGDAIKDGLLQTSISMALPAVLHGWRGWADATKVNPSQKYAIVEAGLHPKENIELIDQLVEKGQITPDRADQIKEIIKQTDHILEHTDGVKSDGTMMTEQEVSDLTFQMLRKKTMEGKLKNAPDPQKPAIEAKIHEINQDIADLHTADADKQKSDLNQLLTENLGRIKEKIPPMESSVRDAVKRNEPETVFKEIHDQATQTTKVDGKEVSSRAATEEIFGKPLVEKAFELHNQKTKTDGKANDAHDAQAGNEGQVTPEKPQEGAAPAATGTEKPAASSFLQSRHADTVHDEQGIVSGPNNKELSPKGKRDANDLAKDVEGKGVTKIITSGLERSKETGDKVGEKTGATVENRPALNTWDIKDFDGLKDEEFKAVQQWFVENPEKTVYEGPDEKYKGKEVAESINEYAGRIIPEMEKIEKEAGPETLVINHSNNMMLWDAYLKNDREWNDQARQDYLKSEKPEPATLTSSSADAAIKEVVNSGGKIEGKNGFYTEEEIEASHKKLDAEHDKISSKIQDRYRKIGIPESKIFEKSLPEVIAATKENAIQRNAMQAHNEALFKKIVAGAIDGEKGMSFGVKEMLKDYFQTKGEKTFSKTTTKEVRTLLKDENGIKVLAKMIAKQRASDMGLDFEGVMGSQSGWSDHQKADFLSTAAAEAKAILKNILESVQKGYGNNSEPQQQRNAIPERGPEGEVPRPGTAGENIPAGSEGVGPGQQGQVPAGETGGTGKGQEPPGGAGGSPVAAGGEPSQTGIAERVKKEREAAAGVKAPEPGTGHSVEEGVEIGRRLLKEGADPEKILDEFNKDKKINADGVSIVRARLEQLAKAKDAATEKYGEGSPQEDAAIKEEEEWAARIQPMQTEWSEIGRRQQGSTDLDTGSVTSIKRAFKEQSGKPLTEKQTETAQNLHAKIKEQETTISDLKKKLDAAHNIDQTKTATTFTEKAKKAADVIRKLKNKEFTFKDSNGNDIPVHKMGISWNDVVELGAKAIEKTGQIADGIAAIIDKVKEADWYKALSKADQDRFAKELEDHYTGIADKKTASRIKALEKELDDLQAGKVKSKTERTPTAREKELKDQIFEAKDKLGLIKPKSARAPKTAITKSKIDIATDFVDKKDNKFTADESKAIWEHAKKVMDGGKTDFHDVVNQVAMDSGLSNEQVRRAIAQPKDAKVVTDKMYAAMYKRNQVVQAARAWVNSADQPWLKKFWYKAIKIPSAIVTFGHGSVAPITHVGTDLFRPSNWKSYFNFMANSYIYSFGGLTERGTGRYEKAMGDLVRDPMFVIAKRAGLKIDPTDISGDDYSKYQGVFGKLSKMGERGFNAMKPYRLEQFKKIYGGLSDQAKSDPEVVKAIAHMVNISSGTTDAKIPKGADVVFFAPKLVTSQYQRIFSEPAKAAATFVNWKNAPEADKLQAKMVARHAGEMMATYGALLAANQAILTMTGSKQKINTTNPLDPDWMKFKMFDKTVDASGGMNSALRFVVSLMQEGARANGIMKTDEKSKPGATEGRKILQQLTNKLNPAAGDVVEGFSGTDMLGNPLPWSAVKPSAGKEKLKWSEYLATKLPIPLAEGIKTFSDAAKENGMPDATIENYLEGFMIGALTGTTGAKISAEKIKKESTSRRASEETQ